tara:strand:+ start:259 stop:882 length:624 start_codon:yes stop_codon:yes gene_type:complete
MKILSHRGFWKNSDEKNKFSSFERTIKNGFGTETDLRDYKGEIVISHDIANDNVLNLDDIFSLFSDLELTLALNIKSDGLQKKLKKKLIEFNINDYFVFDMSVPDTLNYIKNGFKVFIRQSEYESNLFCYDLIDGIWLDCFEDIWYDKNFLLSHLNKNKKVCVVSSELHGRNYIDHWELIKSWKINDNENLLLCTDFPSKAKTFFKN